jgi:hypothetical protein
MGRSLRIDFAQRKEDRPATEYSKEVRRLTTPATITRTLFRTHHCTSKQLLFQLNHVPPSFIPQRPQKSSGYDSLHSIFLGNLAWDVTPELVMDMVNDVLGPGLFNQGKLRISPTVYASTLS